MGTVDTRSKTLVSSSSVEDEPDKTSITGGVIKESIESSIEKGASLAEDSVEVKQENGVRCSLNGEEVLGEEMARGVAEIDKLERVAEEGKIVYSSLVETRKSAVEVEIVSVEKLVKGNGVEERNGEKISAEENGGSWVENGDDPNGKLGLIEVSVVDSSVKDDGEVGGEEHEFSVGDFVWGKIKSHPWWPGQIYDPSDASDVAEKLKPKSRLLVAYFGDSTFAWCHSSQLKPFEENFEEMSKQSNMKAFVNAVQQAMDEIGRVLELKITCSCVPIEIRTGLDRPVAANAGVKRGVFVPEGEIRKLAAVLAEPSEILAELKRIAQVGFVNNLLQVKVLQSRVSAFYRAKRGCPLPSYHEPQPIPGLEDNWKLMEVLNRGPVEDWLPTPLGVNVVHADHSFSQGSPDKSENRTHRRRKQKSIADLIGGENNAQAEIKEVEIALEGISLEEPTPSSTGKKGERGDIDLTSPTGKGRKARLSKSPVGINVSNLKSSVKKDEGDEDQEKRKRGRPKKKSVNFEDDGGRKNENENENETEAGSVSKISIFSDGSSRSDDIENKDQSEMGSLSSPRERKKSKYLSPPFTDVIISGRRKRESEIESPRVSAGGQAGEEMAGAADQNLVKCSSETLPKKLSNSGLGDESIDPTKAKASAAEVLSELRSAATDPFHAKGRKSMEAAVNFMSIFRSSVYRNDPEYKLVIKEQSRRKRKNLDAETGSLVEDPKQQPEKKKRKSNQDKKVAESLDGKSGKQESKQVAEEEASPAELFVTFGPGSNLPTKADLIRMYGKYGNLDEAATEMFYNNFCARVSFLKSSEAEVAFNASQTANPFVPASVSFRLRYHTGAFKTRDLTEISGQRSATPAKTKAETHKKPKNSQPNGGGKSDLEFVKQKLETVFSLLENSDGKMSPTIKSNLEGEIKGLLEKVSKMAESSSS
ncbi:hypothetical protein UlMin_043191 [Ulmus minor]